MVFDLSYVVVISNTLLKISGVDIFLEYCTPFCGQHDEILDFHYFNSYSVVVFCGKSFDMSIHEHVFNKNTMVVIDAIHEWYVSKIWYDDQQYILATQAKRLSYPQDPY